MNGRPAFILFVVCLFVFLPACSAPRGDNPFVPEDEPVIVDDGPCFDAVKVDVWADLNGDGVWDEGEPPLEDVLIIAALTGQPENNVQAETGASGSAYLPFFEMEDCDPLRYDILFPRQVAGYAFPDDPLVSIDEIMPGQTYAAFGLVPEE